MFIVLRWAINAPWGSSFPIGRKTHKWHCVKNQVSIPRIPIGNQQETPGLHVISKPATPSFPVVSIPWKVLTAPIPEWKPRENHWKPGVSNRKPRGNHWKPGVARQETPWEHGVAREETTRKLGVNLMESTGFHLRTPYVNYLLINAVALIVHTYCIGLTFS